MQNDDYSVKVKLHTKYYLKTIYLAMYQITSNSVDTGYNKTIANVQSCAFCGVAGIYITF